ncbi:peptidase U32 family protein [Oceanidesulfovibrio marinus]|uniref:peptidase U32 family protein n=1 Tax=Oceanidesulfovibrio marinus TaxID=370038 RepID=UPI001FD018A9|nr:peptidase U32 family protein [Oceanidesulfovibrio marinus]
MIPDAPHIPELLAPAGTPDKLATALRYGADAVYLGGPDLSLRAKAAGFDIPALKDACTCAHTFGARVYYTLNILPRESGLHGVRERLEALNDLDPAASPHALIVADPGVVRLAQRIAPRYPLHLSTQANTSNSEALAFWADQGVARVNLARELTGPDIAAMAAAGREHGVEVECFVHGAQCLAISGRCLLGAAINRRSANLGLCTQPCRFEYAVRESIDLEEKTRPGHTTWRAACADGFGALFAPEDLCLVHHLGWFGRVGVAALKIEGRMRSEQAIAQTVDAYRAALDGLCDGRMPGQAVMDELRHAAARPLGTGFFCETPRLLYDPEASPFIRRPMAGKIIAPAGDHRWSVAVKGRWDTAAAIDILVPGLQRPRLAPGDYALENAAGERITLAHSGMDAVLVCDHPDLSAGFFLRLA